MDTTSNVTRKRGAAPVNAKPIRILFVCLGNICRSPTAEGVFRQLVKEAGLAARVIADSAGTGDYHIGERPDPRACWAALRRGYDLSALRARQVGVRDFDDFDYVLAMDEHNLSALEKLVPSQHRYKLRLFTDFSSMGVHGIPDPYIGGPDGFERVLDLVEDAAQGLLRHIRSFPDT